MRSELCMLMLCVGGGFAADCAEDYEDAIVDYEEENHLYASCLNATAILESAALEVMWTRPVGRTEDCFRDCLNFGIANLTDRTPADSVKAVYDTNTTTGASRCSCLTHRGDQNIPIDTRCNPDEPIRPGPTVYDIPLQCALLDRDGCNDVTGCEFYNKCCYLEGSVPENGIWKHSQQLLQWVFLVVAVLFTGQLLMFCVLSCVARVKRYFGYGDDGELGEELLGPSSDEYCTYLEALPPLSDPAATSSACTICLEDLLLSDGTSIILPDCSHAFHLTCIREYCCHEARKQALAVCPNCRVAIDPRVEGPPKKKLFWPLVLLQRRTEESTVEGAESSGSPRDAGEADGGVEDDVERPSASPRRGGLAVEMQAVST